MPQAKYTQKNKVKTGRHKHRQRTNKNFLNHTHKNNKNNNHLKQQFGGKIDCTRELGEGGYGVAMYCLDGPNPIVIKIPIAIGNDPRRLAAATRIQRNEIAILKEIYDDAHKATVPENIIKIVDLPPDEEITMPPSDSEKYNYKSRDDLLATELCNGDLYDAISGEKPVEINGKKLKTLRDEDVLANFDSPSVVFNPDDVNIYIARQIFTGLNYLFHRRIVHLDIKTENIFFKNMPDGRTVLKIADFGSATRHRDFFDGDTINVSSEKFKSGTLGFIPSHHDVLKYTTFFRDLYAFINTIYLIVQLTHANPIDEQTDKPTKILSVPQIYTYCFNHNLNFLRLFGRICKIIAHLEQDFYGFYKSNRRQPTILEEIEMYKPVYHNICAELGIYQHYEDIPVALSAANSAGPSVAASEKNNSSPPRKKAKPASPGKKKSPKRRTPVKKAHTV